MDVCAVALPTVLRCWRGVDGRAAAVMCDRAVMCWLCLGSVFWGRGALTYNQQMCLPTSVPAYGVSRGEEGKLGL
jgi:hypothetical protein